MALSHGIPNELVKAILALMSADNSDDMATLWGNARIAFEHAEADARAAGYAEAIDKAVDVALSTMTRLNTNYRHEIAGAIRALVPESKNE